MANQTVTFNKDDLLAFMDEHNACYQSYDFVYSCKDIEECLEKAKPHYIVWVLSRNSQLSKHLNNNHWNKLDGWNWVKLLIKQPQFAKYCDWNKLYGCNWATLLIEHPQFAKYCDWSKLDGWDWVKLLREQPQFTKYCDWNKLDDNDRDYLFVINPYLKEYCCSKL